MAPNQYFTFLQELPNDNKAKQDPHKVIDVNCLPFSTILRALNRYDFFIIYGLNLIGVRNLAFIKTQHIASYPADNQPKFPNRKLSVQ